jgi:hypothetical protein
VNSTEKKTSPGQVVQFDRRRQASLDSLVALLRPSGTVNTLPEADAILEAAFGSKTNTALATTVASVPTTTGATLTSGAGLAVNDAISIVVSAKKYVRFLTAINTGTGVATWAPALPAAPIVGAVVKCGTTYKLSTDLSISLAILQCLTSYRRECRGIGIDKFAVALDGNAEPQFTVSGPAQKHVTDASAVADPGTFTQVGGNPPSGIIGETYIADVSYLIKKAGVDLSNGLAVRNSEYGANTDTGEASELYREDRRAVGVTLEAFAETQASLHDFAIAGTRKSFFNQTGRTDGNIIAIYCPIVEWKVPDLDAPEGPASWSFKGTALESSDGANDEIMLALL